MRFEIQMETIVKIRTILFSAAIAVLFATPAMAAGKSTLTVGGNTIAGPGSVKALPDDVDTLVDNVDENVCVTIVNSGKGVSGVRLDMTDDNPTLMSTTVPAGVTAAFCQNNNITIQIVCLAAKSCDYSWRVDRK